METLSIAKDDRKVHPDKSPKPTNGPDLTTILFFVGQLRQKRVAKKIAAKAESAVRKQAINAGLVIQELDEAMADADMEPEAVLAKYARRKQYAEALGTPIGEQFSLFDVAPRSGIPTFKEQGEKAYQSGFARGLLGEGWPDEQAYPPGSDFHTSHLEGWNAGQKMLMERIGQLKASDDAADAARAVKKAAKNGDAAEPRPQ